MVKMVQSLDALNKELKAASDAEKAVLVDFYATWCGPCKKIAPKLQSLSEKYASVIVLKVDVDEADDIAAKYEIEAMPTFLVLKNKEVVDKLQGASPDSLTELFVKYSNEYQLDPNESTEKVQCCGKF